MVFEGAKLGSDIARGLWIEINLMQSSPRCLLEIAW